MEQINDVRETDIAIVGMACRFPGARTVEEFWQNLCDGRDSTTFHTEEELLESGVDPTLLCDPNYVRAGQFLPDIEIFDADYFRITSDEAEILDPQQRHFLECAVEALEDSGHNPGACPGRIGVYAGAGLNTYLLENLHEHYRKANPLGRYRIMVANDKDFLATRVAYKLDLRGPAVNINTACSTSLVAVHTACLGLLNGDCDLALVGAVHLTMPPAAGYLHQNGMIFSPDGRCRAFDAQAQGTVVGDGVGAVVLKPLRDALMDGNEIRAVIKGSGINNDGASKAAYSAPSVNGQVAVITDALTVAGCHADSITYIEAHGTATALGDPVEVAALTQAFRSQTDRTGYCALGSVKTNIGHLDAAAGMAGLMKTALMLQHRRLVPSLHFTAPNPEIDFADSPFRVNTELRNWPADRAPRRAGVSSFGIGGTNAHVVLEEPPARAPVKPSESDELLVLSARSSYALEELTQNLIRYFERHPELDLRDVARTLGEGRRSHPHRRAVVCRDVQDAVAALNDQHRMRTAHAEVDHAAVDVARLLKETSAQPRDVVLATVADLWLAGADIDWVAFYSGGQHRLTSLPTYPFKGMRYWINVGPERQTPARQNKLRHRLDATEDGAKAQLVVSFIQNQVAQMIGNGTGSLPDPDANLIELGLDSLILLEIAAKLSDELERQVPSLLFLDHPTISDFVGNLSTAIGLPGCTAPREREKV